MSPNPKKTIKPSSERAVERFCTDYLEDKLTSTQRKIVEERISKGDKLIIETLQRLQGEAANVKQAKTPEERYHEDLKSLGVVEETEKPSTQSAPIHEVQQREKPKKKSSRQAFKAVIKGPKTIFSVFIASILFLLVVLIIYLQSERTRLHTQLRSQQAITEEAKQSAFLTRTRALEQMDQYAWLKNLVRQDGLVQKNLQIEDITQTPTQIFFHPPSLKLAIIPGDWELPENQQLSVWSTGSAEAQLVGLMHPLKKDSLYRQWNTSSLLLFENLEFRVGTISEGVIDYNQSSRLISTTLP